MIRKIATSGFMVLFLLGCGTTYLKKSSNVSKTKKKYDKILVVARAKDKVARIKFEDQVVKDFALQWVGRFQVKDPSSLTKTIEKYSQELTLS